MCGCRSLIFIVLVLLAALQPCQAEPESQKLITVAGDANFPPYEFIDERNGLKVYRGFNIDLIRAVIDTTDHEVQFIPMPWEEAVRALQEGRVNAVSGMKYDEDRALQFDFSEAYLINSLTIFVPKSTSTIAELEDLDHKKVAVQKDDIAYQKLKNRSIELVAAENQEETLKLLVDGKVEAVVGNKMAGQYILQRMGAMDSVKTVGGIIQPERYGLAVRRGDDKFLELFNTGLHKLKENGTYDQIYFKWFGEPVDYPAHYYKKYFSYLWGGLVVTIIVIFVFVRISYLLKREVARRTREISRVNDELRDKNRYIRNVNQYQSSVLNSGYGGILTCDAAGTIKFANHYACDRLVIDAEPAGLRLPELPACDWIARALRAGSVNGEISLAGQWIEYAICHLDFGGENTETVIHFRDITEEKALREEVVKRHKMEALGQLVASIAHEIRTPLTSIKAFTELLPSKYDNPDFRKKMSRFVPQEIERLNRVVNDLLTYSNPPAVQIETLSLKALAEGVLVYFADTIAKQSINFTVELAEHMRVSVDKQQMRQVLINILLNAVQALAGRPNPRLSLTADYQDGAWQLLIADNGPGIAPETVSKVFEPFFTTKAGGTGLGLFVSYQLARRNGVAIRLESVLNQGTTVRLVFSQDRKVVA